METSGTLDALLNDDQVLFVERPYVQAIAGKYWGGKACFACFRPAKTFQCSRCHQAWYCGRSCQLRDWQSGQHAWECAVLQHVADGDKNNLKIIIDSTKLRLSCRLLGRSYQDAGQQAADECLLFPERVLRRRLQDLSAASGKQDSDRPSYLLAYETVYQGHSKQFAKVPKKKFSKAYNLVAAYAQHVGQPVALFGSTQSYGQCIYLQSSGFRGGCGVDVDVEQFHHDDNCLIVRLLSGRRQQVPELFRLRPVDANIEN